MTARTLRTYEAAALGGKLPRRAVLLLAASFALAPRAEAFVYWGGDTPGYPIGRANLDGTSMDTSFIWLGSQPACEMASDGKHLYWAHRDVGRANLPDGTGVDATFIDVVDEAGAIAVDPEYVYWTNWDNPYVLGDSSAIGRADHDGSNVDQSFISLPAGSWGLAVDGGHIYWTDAYKIGRADLDGSNVDPNFIDLATTFPTGLAVNATHIFFSHTGSSIGRANLNGTGVDASFITDVYPPYPHGVAVDGAHVYSANPNRLGGPLIGRADVDGSNVDRSFISEDPRQPFFPPCGGRSTRFPQSASSR